MSTVLVVEINFINERNKPDLNTLYQTEYYHDSIYCILPRRVSRIHKTNHDIMPNVYKMFHENGIHSNHFLSINRLYDIVVLFMVERPEQLRLVLLCYAARYFCLPNRHAFTSKE